MTTETAHSAGDKRQVAVRQIEIGDKLHQIKIHFHQHKHWDKKKGGGDWCWQIGESDQPDQPMQVVPRVVKLQDKGGP